MYTRLEEHWFTYESLGTDDSDKRLEDWYTMGLSVGSGDARMFVGTFLKYRKLERNGLFTETIAKLRPHCNEDKDALLKRMTSQPGGAVNGSSDAEWRTRTPQENERWLQHCRATRRILSKTMILIGKVGVMAARIILDREGPPKPDAVLLGMYRDIAAKVGSHKATFNAMTRVQVHLRVQGMSHYLILQTTTLALIDDDFANLPAEEGTSWYQQCCNLLEFCQREAPLDVDGTHYA